MWKKIFFGSIILLLVSAGIYWFWYMKEIKAPISSAINAIPIDAAIVFESKQSHTVLQKLMNSSMWQELAGIPNAAKLNDQFHAVDSVLSASTEITKLLLHQSLFISAHVSGTNSFDFLYAYSLPHLHFKSSFNHLFKTLNNNHEPTNRIYDDVDLFTIRPKNDSLNFAFLNGILMVSTNHTLVEDAIRQLKSGISFSTDKNFNKIVNTAGKNVDGNLYINYKKLSSFLYGFVNTAVGDDIKDIGTFADYSGWDVTIKNNSLLLNGFTQANDSSNSFLNLFSKQAPQEIELTKIIPSTTTLLLLYGISDMSLFQRDYKKYLNYKQLAQSYEQFVTGINKKYRINIERSLTNWITNEMAVVITEPVTPEMNDNCYAVFHTGNINEASDQLNAIVDSVCKKNVEEKDTTIYLDYVITHLNIPRLLPAVLGWQFNHIQDNYFTTVDDYVVIANSARALKKFIKDYESNKTLEKDKSYRNFMENISAEASIYLYAAPSRLSGISNRFIKPSIDQELQKEREHVRKFEKIGWQFSNTKKLFYSAAFITYNPLYGQQTTPLWETKIDTSFHAPPFLVLKNGSRDIFIQDDTNTLFFINNEGKIKWRKTFHETIKGNVFQPPGSKNSPAHLLFHTTTAIYKYDEKGHAANGFPVTLTSPISNIMNVCSYEKSSDYRILFTCKDKSVRCLNPAGETVTGFKSFKTDNPVSLPVQHFKVSSKDYLCIIDMEGKIYITDRLGEMKIKLKERFPPLTKNFFIENGMDNNHTFLVTADSTGKIIRISLTDTKEQFRPQRFNGPVSMIYCDLTNDGNKEYIFQSGNELCIYDQRRILLSSYIYKEEMFPCPFIFTFPDGNVKIGAVARTANLVYLFNPNGTLANNFPVKGKTPFAIGDLTNEGVFTLITGTADNTVVAYPIE